MTKRSSLQDCVLCFVESIQKKHGNKWGIDMYNIILSRYMQYCSSLFHASSRQNVKNNFLHL